MKTKLIIFGITGDLSVRKLLPAIQAVRAGGEADDLQIIGVSRRQVDVDELLESSLNDGADLRAITSVYTMNLAVAAEYRGLKDYIDLQADEQAVVYLSVPPTSATQIVDFLGEAGLNTPNVKLLFEKPFGVDYASAKDMIERTSRYYSEDQIYRIDHYLAKEMAQNIVAFRSGNALFRHVWNNLAIEKIEIVAIEKIGIEGRAQFYEQTGALRDVLQGHLLQLLALTIMDIPSELDWSQLPSLRLAALEGLKPADQTQTLRAQYEGYQEEVENKGSMVETFIRAPFESTVEKWRGVAFILTTGKAMTEKTTEVRVYFKGSEHTKRDRLVFRIQPNEGIEIDLVTKKTGYEREFENQKLEFTYAPNRQLPDAYEQVLVDALRSRKSLFTSGDEVLRSWQLIQPLLDTWSMANEPLLRYAFGGSVEDIVG